MAVLYSSGKACPACGKPMTALPDEVAHGGQRYVCTSCDDDPLHDRSPQWAASPLKPPAK